jgi:hypothetical protein
MTDVISKIDKLRKETMAKMDRLHILLLLSPSIELSKQLAYTEDIYLSMLELLENNKETTEKSIINRLNNDTETVNNLLRDIKEDISKEIRLMPLLYLDKLKGEVLAFFYGKLEELLELSKGLDNLINYIKETSVEEIIVFSDHLLEYINKYASDNEKRLIPIQYIESLKTKQPLDLKQWEEFQKKISFTLKYINGAEEDITKARNLITEEYWLFDLYYFIMILLSN